MISAFRWAAIPFLALFLLGLAACGDDDDEDKGTPGTAEETAVATIEASETGESDDEDEDEEATRTRTSTPDEDATGQPNDGDDETPGATESETETENGGGDVDPTPTSEVSRAFESLSSYQYEVVVVVAAENTGQQFEESDAQPAPSSDIFENGDMLIGGAVSGQDLDVTLQSGNTVRRVIILAGEQFEQVEEQWFGPDIPEATGLTPPELFASSFLNPEDLAGLPYEDAVVNDVPTRRYELEPADVQALEDLLRDDGTTQIDSAMMQVWMAADGAYPVSLTIQATGVDEVAGEFEMDLTFDLYEINVPVVIERPM